MDHVANESARREMSVPARSARRVSGLLAALALCVAGCGAKTGLITPCRVDLVPIPPEIIFVLDASGSTMPDPTRDVAAPGWAWPEIAPSVPTLAEQFSEVSFGALYYPVGEGAETCSVADHLGVIPRTNAGDALREYLAMATQRGHTPTAAALAVVADYVEHQPSPRTRVVVLVTDGSANCNASLDCAQCHCPTHNCCLFGAESCDDDVGVPANERRLQTSGVLTAVVGAWDGRVSAGTPEQLRQILDGAAAAGGFGPLFLATPGHIFDQLSSVVSIARRTCQFTSPNLVAFNGSAISLGGESIPSDPVNGWSRIDGTRDAVQFNGNACERYRALDGLRVSIEARPSVCGVSP